MIADPEEEKQGRSDGKKRKVTYSQKGSLFSEHHHMGWLRGTYHHFSEEYLQKYLDEFYYKLQQWY